MHDRLARGGAEQERAMPWMQVSTVPVSTAFLPSVGLSKGMTSIL